MQEEVIQLPGEGQRPERGALTVKLAEINGRLYAFGAKYPGTGSPAAQFIIFDITGMVP